MEKSEIDKPVESRNIHCRLLRWPKRILFDTISPFIWTRSPSFTEFIGLNLVRSSYLKGR